MSAPHTVGALLDAWRLLEERERESLLGEWKRTYGRLYGKKFLAPGIAETEALRKHHGAPEETGFHDLLFCVHTRLALLAESVAGVEAGAGFGWPGAREGRPGCVPRPKPGIDFFKPLYQSLVPRAVRHALGEYYTPDWLAELLLNEAGYDGDTDKRLLDPACGSGTFLVLAIERAKRRSRAADEPPQETARRILASVWGFERNPIAARAARANYRLALGDLLDSARRVDVPVFLLDALLDPLDCKPFDIVIGNPPWIRWDHLPETYREATLPLWKRYGLFSLKGFQTWLGAGKKDLSMLFTFAAADRYLKDGGLLAFLITQEVFKSKGAGEGFRHFRLGDGGAPLGVIRAHDFTALRPFEGASNKAAAIVLRKGEETVYPAAYYVWTRRGGRLEKAEFAARPMGSLLGPWQTVPGDSQPHTALAGENAYRAILGANANPYGVFWLEPMETANGMARVRNLNEKGKRDVPRVEAWIETDLIYPAVRGADIRRWRAIPGVHILAIQDPSTRRGYPEEIVEQRWPKTLDYLAQFRDELLARALYRKYHEAGGHPFYSQFNISAQTFAPYKVAWKRMSNDLTAAVLSEWQGPLGTKLILPLETTAFIAAGGLGEAHYLCAVLNSRPARAFLKSFSAAGRGFGTPSAIAHIRIPKFDPRNGVHRELAQLSGTLHESEGSEEREERIDDLVRSL